MSEEYIAQKTTAVLYKREKKENWLIVSSSVQSAEERRSQISVMAVRTSHSRMYIKNSQNVLHSEYSKYISELFEKHTY